MPEPAAPFRDVRRVVAVFQQAADLVRLDFDDIVVTTGNDMLFSIADDLGQQYPSGIDPTFNPLFLVFFAASLVNPVDWSIQVPTAVTGPDGTVLSPPYSGVFPYPPP